jgi:hypothetical protein
MKHVRVYNENAHIGYVEIDENNPPEWIVLDVIRLYQLKSAYWPIQNDCYMYVGTAISMELDTDTD